MLPFMGAHVWELGRSRPVKGPHGHSGLRFSLGAFSVDELQDWKEKPFMINLKLAAHYQATLPPLLQKILK